MSKFTTAAKTAPRAKRRMTADVHGTTEHDAQQAAAERMAQARDEYLRANNVPTSRRVLVATICGIVSSASTVYFTMPIVELATVGALLFTGSAFLAFLVWVLGVIAAIWASVIAGSQTFGFVATFNVDAAMSTARSIKDSASRRVSLVRDWFKKPEVVEAR